VDARAARERRAADAGRHAIGLLDIGAIREAPRSSSTSSGARRAQRDDLIALPSTWVIARISARAHVTCTTRDGPHAIEAEKARPTRLLAS
jgi:hypothetical protein